MISGTKFCLRLEGVGFAIKTPGMRVIREHKELPNFEMNLNLLYIHALIEDTNVNAKVMIKEIKLIDYFKLESESASNRMIASASNNAMRNIHNVDNSMMDDRFNAQSAAGFGDNN